VAQDIAPLHESVRFVIVPLDWVADLLNEYQGGIMDITWTGTVTIAAPIERVYAYLADFPRHAEWAQTVERLELIQPGNDQGVGARYRTAERQSMQHDRQPFAPIRRGMRVVTICEVRELTPLRRIAWHAHTSPKALGLSADLAFAFAVRTPGETELTQQYCFHQPRLMVGMFKLMYGNDIDQKGYAQWEAGLRNIKLILEAPASHIQPEHARQAAYAR
jgi:uncharacterized protein YndB with AHSA1/START domain